ADPRAAVDDPHRAGMRGRELEDRQPLGEPGSRVSADLRQQEGGGSGMGEIGLHAAHHALTVSFHQHIILLMNHSQHRGPSLSAVALVYATLAVASVAVPTAIAGGQHFPSPFDPAAPGWFTGHPAAALLAAFLLFCSAVPLGIFAATASSRLQFLGMKVAGIQIALFGGIAASIALGTSGFAAWTLA